MTLSENKYLLTSLTKACRLKNDKVRSTLPIRKGLLLLLVQSVSQLYPTQPYLCKLYRAMLMTAYYGLFTVGEIAESNHTVKAVDVHIGTNKDKMMFILHTSKTHGRDRKPQIIKIRCEALSVANNANNSQRICPFKILREYIAMQKKYINTKEPFFIFRDRTPVSINQFRRTLKALIELNNLNPAFYSCHGICAGRATDLAQYLSIETVRKIGRWKSSAIYTYLRA